MGDGKRPGWHIECSAMSMAYLGDTLDIHAGGRDLLFPHHENEIAQSEGATGKPYVRYWMHNGFINIDNEKMSKSEGNFFTVREISQQYDLENGAHVHAVGALPQPSQFQPRNDRSGRQRAGAPVRRARSARSFCEQSAEEREPNAAEQELIGSGRPVACRSSTAAMEDDLNTADAIAALFELVREIFKLPQSGVSTQAIEKAEQAMFRMTDILGLLMKKTDEIPPEVSRRC